MFFRVNGLQIKNLQKANDDKIITVDIIANHLTEDTENEIILKEAFSPETVKEFLDIGVIEYWHETKNPYLTKQEKNQAILGKPVGFRWENGLPVVTANLTKSHSIVQEMLPHLEADQPVYAASMGGGKTVLEVTGQNGEKKKVIPRVKWDHLAIAPANAVINREPGVNVKLLKKANELLFEFSDMQTFKNESKNFFGKEQELKKALEAPSSVSDMYETTGGVITKQDLEKSIVMFTEDDALSLLDTILGIKDNSIPITKKQYLNHFQMKGKKDFGDKSYRIIDKYFKLKKEQK